MNNSQFRRLLLSDTAKQNGNTSSSPSTGTPKALLGARKHSSIPMTPRQVGRGSIQNNFARQLAERNGKAHPGKKARASAPKGTKLAAGYTDRTKERIDEEDNEIAKRIKNLEDSMKLGQIDRATFENLVLEITGGDIGTTHLVKGLDRRLLDRVRRGEDVLAGTAKKEEEQEAEEAPEVEDAFDELAEEDVGPIVREKAEKKGEKRHTPPPPVAGVKRSRNDILKDLKRQREEAAAAAAAEHEKKFPSLGAGFRKITAQAETTRLEVDDKGREVLIITGADGKEKRKIRKQKAEAQPAPEVRHDLDQVDKPINMHNLPEAKPEESEDEDIFEGVGSNYNPLADFDQDDDDDDDSDAEEEGELASPKQEPHHQQPSNPPPPPPPPPPTTTKRNYFSSTPSQPASQTSPADATVRAALLKARTLDASSSSSLLQNLSSTADPTSASAQEARLQKRAAHLLAAADRDLDDMDMGFGASRFDDAEEMEREGEKVTLSQWRGLDDDDAAAAAGEEEEEGGAKGREKKRKRGGKKRGGDKNKVEDVLRVMERQKEKKTTTLG